MTDVSGRFRFRWLIWSVALFVVTGGMLLSLLPEMVRFGALHWLRDHGGEQATIEDINLNLFTGSLTLIGLKAGEGVQIRRLTLHMDWAPLWQRTLLIRSLYLHGGRLLVHQDSQGRWQWGDIRFDTSAERAVDDGGASWRVLPLDVHLSQIDLQVKGVLSDRPLSVALPLELMLLHMQDADKAGQQMRLRLQTGAVTLAAAGYQLGYGRLDVTGQLQISDDLSRIIAGPLQVGLNQAALGTMSGQSLLKLDDLNITDLVLPEEGGLVAATVTMLRPTVSKAATGVGALAADHVEAQGMHIGADRSFSADAMAIGALAATKLNGGTASLRLHAGSASKLAVSPTGAASIAKLVVDGLHADRLSDVSDQFDVRQLQAESLAVDEKQQARIGNVQLGAVRIARHGVSAAGEAPMYDLKLAGLQLGQATVNANGEAGFKRLQLDDIRATQAAGDQFDLKQLQAESFSWSAGQSLQMALLRLNGLSLDRQVAGLQWLAVDGATLAGLHLAGIQKGGFSGLVVNGVRLPAAGDRALGWVASINVGKAALDHGNYHIGSLHVAGMDLNLGRSKSGGLDIPGAPGPGPSGGAATTLAEGGGHSPHIVVDDLVVEQGGRVTLRDESVSPPFSTRMKVEHLRLGTLDLSGHQPTDMDIRLALDESAEASVQGHIRLQSEPSAEINIGLKRIRLPALSGYVEPDFGRSIHTGQLDMESKLVIGSGHIDAANKLLIRSLTLGDSALPGKSLQGFSMPLDMSLDMLRNDRGDIALDVPISGSLDDPDINMRDIINKALLSSFSSGAMTYAALALQPYGSIIVAANLAGDLISAASRPRLTPMLFAARESVLSPSMQEYAAKIAGLMKSKGLRLHICGVATRAEGDATHDTAGLTVVMSDGQLLQLAAERSEHVQQAITSHGVASDQLFGCRPELDGDKARAQPRVELLLD